jgi:exosortase D (VPLPA-CTERM-specific)
MSVESIPPFGNSGTVWKVPVSSVLLAGLAAALSLWLFWDGLAPMWAAWMEDPVDGYGLLIPPIAAFLVWQRKDRLERDSFQGSWWGMAVVLLGGVLLLVGQLGTVFTVVQYAYLVTVYGLILAFTGLKPFRLLAGPLLILVFMVPFPEFLMANLSTKLQLLSSNLGVWFIRLFDISVFVEGNVIDMGGYKLQVAEACDGLRYLFPLMTLGFLMAYFYKGAAWKRIVVFLSSIPITVIMNSFRIGTIGIMVEHWGIAMAEGFLHDFQGWAVFMVCTAMLIGEIALLNRIGREAGTWRQLFGIEFPAPAPRNARVERRSLPAPFIAACGALLAFAAILLLVPRPAEVFPERASFIEFPMNLGAWSGRRETLDGIYADTLKLDDYLLADYQNGAGSAVNLYIAYYNSQRKGEAVHSPRSCLPGGGWQLREFGQHTLPNVGSKGRPLRVNRTLIELGNQRELVYYWFQQRGRVIDNEFAVKWYLFWDALTRHRTDGALVRLIVDLPATSNVADADERLNDMARRIVPMLIRYVPN